MNRIPEPELPAIDQQGLVEAAAALGVPGLTAQSLDAALKMGKLVGIIGPRVVGYARLLEVIETARKAESDIPKSYTIFHEGEIHEVDTNPVEVAKAKYNFGRLRLEAAKALIESDPIPEKTGNGDEKPARNGTPKPGEVVGIGMN